MPGTTTCVLLVAAGAAWESRALRLLADTEDVTVLKRCVDVDDLLASATTGQADAAVVGLDAPGLDSRAVDLLGRHGVRAIGVIGGRMDEDASRLRASRIGVGQLVSETGLEALTDVVRDQSVTTAMPEPTGMAEPAPLVEGDVAGAGRVVAIWGPQGAPGRTTVACGVAAELARRGQPVVVVDADPWGGSVAQQFGILDEVSGVLSAARLSTAGVLVEELPTVQRAVGNQLSVVTGLPRADRYVEVRAGAVEHLLEVASDGACVLVDTGFSLEDDPGADFGTRPGRNSMTLGALALADEVVVVGSADPVGLSRLARGLVDLREVLAGAAVRVVVNHNRSSLGWSEKEISGMVEGFAHLLGIHFLPEDRPAVDRALVAGESLSGDGPLVRALAQVADAVLPESVPETGGRRRRLGGTARVRPRRAGRGHQR